MTARIDPFSMKGGSSTIKVGGSTFAVGYQVGNLESVSSVVGDGISLSGNVLVVSKAGAVIDGVDLRGYQVEVRADNVTIKNSLFNATGYHTINQLGNATGMVVEYNTFDGEKADNRNTDLIASERGTTTVRNNEFFNLPSDGINTVGGLIEKNYFSGAGYQSGAHADAISIHATHAPVTIRQNYIDYVTPPDARVPGTNAAIKIVPHFGPVSNVTVDGNVLLGGGYTIYAGNAEHGASNIKIINNDIGLGQWGDLYPSSSKPTNFTYQGNDGVIAASSGATGSAPEPTAPVPSEPVPAPVPPPAPEPSQTEQAPTPTQTAPSAPVPAQTAPPAPAPTPSGGAGTELGPKFFVLGTYVQSDQMMAEWKARGVNTLVQNPDGSDINAWSSAAEGNGLYMIRPPSKDLHADLNNPYLLAWAQPDEPSNTTSNLDYGSVYMDPAEIEAMAAPWRAAAEAEGKFMPVWVNHVAGHITPTWAPNASIMKDYMEGSESDWLSSDGYAIQQNQPFLISQDGYTSTQQGVAADRQLEWSGGKPVMSFIGTSAYVPGQDVPTVGEFNAMAWSSVIHGATGITYFPVTLSPWNYDSTPPELVGAMTAFNKEIAAINDILIDTVNGGSRPHTIYRSANPGATPAEKQLPYPFEATEIQTAQGTYRIILNLTEKEQVLNLPEWGLNNIKFGAYEVKKGYDLGSGASPAPAPGADPTPGPVADTPTETPTSDPVVVDAPSEVPAPNPDAGSSTLTLRVSGDQYKGAPLFDVRVDGKIVATDKVASAAHASGQWADVVVKGDFSETPQSIEVIFKNDLWHGTASTDRNLYVDYVEINGRKLEGEAFGYKGADPKAAALFQAGTLKFTLAADSPAPAPSPTQPAPAPSPTTDSSTPSMTPTITGTEKQDLMRGTSGVDVIFGSGGIDVITASGGNDIVIGGNDKDWISGQGGDDTYVYRSVAETRPGTETRDVICDWGFGKDVFDLRPIDADTAASGNQGFKWIGQNAFTGKAGELRAYLDGNTTIIEGNVNGDKAVDFQIQINTKASLIASDFHL